MVGQTLEEYRRASSDAIHPDDAAGTAETWRRFVAEAGCWNREFQIRGQDGQYRTVLGPGVPVRDSEGRVTGYAGFNYDLTSRRQAEDALRRTTEQLQTVVHCVALPITRCSRELAYVWVSKSYIRGSTVLQPRSWAG